ncbi:MAG: alpha/beta hydrolase [Rhizobiaceae bacterium]|nr:alpha/beta hydrolase [Rhizobiaceae bacterium]
MIWIFVWVLAGLLLAAMLVVAYFVLQTRRIARKAERLVPATGKFITLDGCRIHYVEAGEGPPIVFIHGLGAQLHQFRSTLFPDLARDFRVIALDRPGSGYSTRPYSASGQITDQARLVARFIESLGLEQPLIVGHSLGGAVSLALALDHPNSISGLALLAPLTRHRPEIPPQLAALYVKSPLKRWVLAHTISAPLALKYAQATLAFVFGPQHAPADYMTEGGGWLGLRPQAIFGSCTDVVALEQDMPVLEKRVGEIAAPVGILFGTADKVLDFEIDGKSMKERLPTVELQLLDGVGHMLQFSAPVQTTDFIRRMAMRTIPLSSG